MSTCISQGWLPPDDLQVSQIIMMTGGGLNEEGLLICETADVPVLYKPFLASEVLNLIRGRVFQTRAAVN
jgi:hypothetical protein